MVRHKGYADKAVDVVVVGYGLAGAVAAITAHDEGAETLVIEKQLSSDHWSNSSSSGGVFICPSDVKGAIEHLESLYRVDRDLFWTDRDIIRAWVEYAADNKNWVEKMGAKIEFI